MSRTSKDAQFLPLRIAVVTISDSRTEENDSSGDYLAKSLLEAGHHLASRKIVIDNRYALRAEVSRLIADEEVDIVLTTGSTGLTGRDLATEALEPLFDKAIEGFGELFRMLSYEQVASRSMLSRANAGIAPGKPLFLMPGSTKAVELALTRLILPEIPHLLAELAK